MPARPIIETMIAAAAFAFVSGPWTTAHAETAERPSLRATPVQMLGLADDLLQRGRSAEAVQILDLLSHDPDSTVRNEARFRRSKLFQSAGSSTQAAVLLRKILDEKPDSTAVRLQLAQLLDQMGDKDGAWRQVRAAQAVGLPPEVARIVDRYSEALRAARPTGLSIEVAIAPDSNISRATRSNTLGTVIGDFTIDEDSQAKSGTGLALQGQAYHRFALIGDHRLLVRASSLMDLYRKPQFNDVAIDLAAGPEFNFGKSRLSVELAATGHWYGQKPFQRLLRLGTAWTRAIGHRSQLRLIGSAALVDNQVNDLEDGRIYAIQGSFEHALTSTTGIALTLGADRQSFRDPGYSTTGWRTGFTAWRDIGRATITLDGQYGRLRADERLSLFPARRSDRYSRLTVGTTFRRLTFGGFAPVTRLVVERNRSTIEFHDYRRVRTELGLVRAF